MYPPNLKSVARPVPEIIQGHPRNCPCNQFPRFPTYVITNHQRHRRTDRRTDDMRWQDRALQFALCIVHRAVIINITDFHFSESNFVKIPTLSVFSPVSFRRFLFCLIQQTKMSIIRFSGTLINRYQVSYRIRYEFLDWSSPKNITSKQLLYIRCAQAVG